MARHGFHHDGVIHGVQAHAAVFLGYGHAQKARLAELAHGLVRVDAVLFELQRVAQRGLAPHEGIHALLKGAMLVVEERQIEQGVACAGFQLHGLLTT